MCSGVDDITATDDLAPLLDAVERLERRPRVGREAWLVREELRRCRRLADRIELLFSSLVTELAGCGEEEWEGQSNPCDWVKEACRTSGITAWNALVVGEQAARLERSCQALRTGEIGWGHLTLLARTAQWVTQSAPVGGASPDPTAAGASPEATPASPDAADDGTSDVSGAATFDEAALLARAREHSVARLRRDCAHARHAADPRRYLRDQVEQVEARFLELKATEEGALYLRGFLDAEGGATLRTALEPLAKRCGEGDHRHLERRLADGLVELCGQTLDRGSLPEQGGQRPHLQVTATLETLQGRDGAPAAELERGGAVAAETARRLGCDAAVTRVVFGPGSAVLDVGRGRRVPASATRRALWARDRGCVWPGCERPASAGHAHHLRHWADGGKTELSNLAVVCRSHHWKVHEGGWRLIRTDQGMVALPPLPRDLGPPARARAPDAPSAV